MKIAILAGGRGTRLSPITNRTPKILVPVRGVPFLKVLLASLQTINPRDIYLLAGYKSDMIADFYNNPINEVEKLTILHEISPLGTGGAIECFAKGVKPLLVINGDTYVDIPFKKMLDFHNKRKADVTILSFKGKCNARGSIYYTKSSKRIKSFSEKNYRGEGVFSTGVFIINPEAIRLLVKRLSIPFSMENDGFPLLIKERRVFAYVSSGTFFDMGTHETLERIRRGEI